MIDRESRAREVMQEINSRMRPERAIDREIALSKERYGRLRPSRFELNHDQKSLYADLDQWRVMRLRDIIEYRYRGNEHRYHRDLTPMAKFGLLRIRQLRDKSCLIHRADTRYRFRDEQHDADVYALYERRKREILAAHCSVASVKTEAQLQSECWRKIGKRENQTNVPLRKAVAKELNLPVIDGKVMFPDVRLEVDIPEGRKWKRETVDL